MTVRTLKKFKVKRFFIFELDDKNERFNEELKELSFSDEESKYSFLKGVFLASGSVNDPKKSRYHFEMSFTEEKY